MLKRKVCVHTNTNHSLPIVYTKKSRYFFSIKGNPVFVLVFDTKIVAVDVTLSWCGVGDGFAECCGDCCCCRLLFPFPLL